MLVRIPARALPGGVGQRLAKVSDEKFGETAKIVVVALPTRLEAGQTVQRAAIIYRKDVLFPCAEFVVREVEGDHSVAGARQVFEVRECLVSLFVHIALLVKGA
jgi:hypothetical protein